MNRRRLLRRIGAAAVTSLAARTRLDVLAQPARAGGCSTVPPAVQLYTLRDALARDARATLAALRGLGIGEAELYGLNGPESAAPFGVPAAELRRLFDANGIRVPMAHVGGELTGSAAIGDIAGTGGGGSLLHVESQPSPFSTLPSSHSSPGPSTTTAPMEALPLPSRRNA